MNHSGYYDLNAVEEGSASGRHREIIGGLWDEIGRHQMEFLVGQGLEPHHRLLDVGCGSLRLGVHAIPYLEAGHYFGTDISAALIEAGRRVELDDSNRARAPATNFAVNEDFDFSHLASPIDYAIAQSVFTHLPLNHLRRCLSRLAPHMIAGGRFYITYFECPNERDLYQPVEQPPAGVVTYDFQDPYHYRLTDLAWAVDRAPWRFEAIGDWKHPRGQQICCYVRQ